MDPVGLGYTLSKRVCLGRMKRDNEQEGEKQRDKRADTWQTRGRGADAQKKEKTAHSQAAGGRSHPACLRRSRGNAPCPVRLWAAGPDTDRRPGPGGLCGVGAAASVCKGDFGYGKVQ